MQSIERYGVVALLFLVVTVAAVLMWGDGRDLPKEARKAVAVRPDGAGAGAAGSTFEAGTPAQRHAPLTDERARLREQRRAKAEAHLSDRSGVASSSPPDPSGLVERRNGQGSGRFSAAGIVPGDRQTSGPGVGQQDSPAEFDSAEAFRQAQVAGLGDKAPDAPSQRSEAQSNESKTTGSKHSRGKNNRQGVPVYVVRKNEVLGKIAQRELGSVKRMGEIIDLNPGLNPDRISEGLQLRMPANWKSGATVASNKEVKGEQRGAQAAPQGARSYVVKKGDSLWSIAESRLGGGKRYPEIEALNPGLKRDSIVAGQTIILPNGKAVQQPASGGPRVAANTSGSTRTRSTRGKVR